jgi:tetratricopeptide (TPR) repeat protein
VAIVAAQAHIDAHREGEAEKALRAAERACAPPRVPRDQQELVTTQLNFGILLYAQQPEAALKEFRAALALDPASVRAGLNTAGALITLHRHQEALTILEATIKRGTEDRDMAFRLEYNAGFALINLCIADRLCDAARGQRYLLKAIEINPEFADTYFQLAALVNDRFGDSRRAMQLFKQACDHGHQQGCTQYEHFKSQIEMLEHQRSE